MEKEINGPGIDTQFERNVLTYRPEIAEIMGSSNVSSPLFDELNPETVIDDVLDPITPQVWDEITTLENRIDKLEKDFLEHLKDVEVPIMSKELKDLIRKDKLTMKDYKDALTIVNDIPGKGTSTGGSNPTTPPDNPITNKDIYISTLIIEEVETHLSDMNGLLEGELYSDVLEIQMDVKDTKYFVQRALIEPLFQLNTPKDDDKQEVLKAMQTMEENLSKEYTKTAVAFENIRRDHDILVMTAYGSKEEKVKKKDVQDAEKKKKDIETRLVTKTEIGRLCKRKTGHLGYHIDYLEECIGFVPRDGEQSKINQILASTLKDNPKMSQEHLLLGLRMGFDKRKEETKTYQNNLRSVSPRKHKVKVQDGLIEDVYLRNEVFYPFHRHMETSMPTEKGGIEEWVYNYLTEGMYALEDMYQKQSMDYFKVQDYEAIYRQRHIQSIIDKEGLRLLYKNVEEGN